MNNARKETPDSPVRERGRSTWDRFWSGDQIPDPTKRKREILSRSKQPRARLWRAIKKHWFWVPLSVLIVLFVVNPLVRYWVINALYIMGRFAFAMFYVIIQFVAIFWFMGRSKVEVIRPEDPKNITFDDYWGQPNLKALVKQWMGLLSDRDEFVQMGGRYINGLLLYGEPGTGKCITGDTRIITLWGYHRIGEIHPARTPDSYWLLDVPVGTVDGVKTASHFYVGGKSKTLRTRTYHGYELEGTPEHPVLCLRPGGKLEWVQLSQLTTDDYVGIARNIEMWGLRHVPEAYLLGILVGDGHIVSGRRVELSTSDPEIAETFKAWAEANGWVAHKAPARYDWYISATEAVRRLNQMGLAAVLARNKTIPDILWRADRESVREFLRGLFDADGHAGKDTGYIELSLSSHQLVKDVQLLLLKSGILSRVTRRRVFHRYKGVRKHGVAWRLTMAGKHAALFYERVGFGLARKQDRRHCLPTTPNPNDDVVPNIGPLLAGWQARYVREERRPTYDMLERAVTEADLHHPTLQWLLEKRPVWSRVESITPGEAEVFDITVPDGHAFVANGFISHNTMLAKAMAGESGVAFISMEGSGFRGMFWGMDVLKMISFVRKARKLAREYGACIAFIDEIDAVGMSRGGVMGGRGGVTGGMAGGMFGAGGGTGALTRLLYEMDGVEEKTRLEKLQAWVYKRLGKKPPPRNWHVLFMGSTNRPGTLDPALVRPGRFDQTIHVSLPDKSGRREIIQGYLTKIKHDDTVDVEALVANTTKSTPAQIMAAITKDSVRIALFDGRKFVNQTDIEKAFLQQWMGIENPIEEMDPAQRRQIAVHEAGHAVAQHYLMPDQRIVHLTIVARARALGFMLPLDEVEVYAQPLRRIVADIMVAMAGHVATRIVFSEYWTGAYSDFNNIRGHLNHLRSLGYFGPPVGDVGFGDQGGKGDDVLKRFWVRLEQQVEQLLQDHYSELMTLTETLLEKNDLSNKEVLAILGPNSRQLKERKKAAAGNGREPGETPVLLEPEAVSVRASDGDDGREEEPEAQVEPEDETELEAEAGD